jgi:hypothetical protein
MIGSGRVGTGIGIIRRRRGVSAALHTRASERGCAVAPSEIESQQWLRVDARARIERIREELE